MDHRKESCQRVLTLSRVGFINERTEISPHAQSRTPEQRQQLAANTGTLTQQDIVNSASMGFMEEQTQIGPNGIGMLRMPKVFWTTGQENQDIKERISDLHKNWSLDYRKDVNKRLSRFHANWQENGGTGEPPPQARERFNLLEEKIRAAFEEELQIMADALYRHSMPGLQNITAQQKVQAQALNQQWIANQTLGVQQKMAIQQPQIREQQSMTQSALMIQAGGLQRGRPTNAQYIQQVPFGEQQRPTVQPQFQRQSFQQMNQDIGQNATSNQVGNEYTDLDSSSSLATSTLVDDASLRSGNTQHNSSGINPLNAVNSTKPPSETTNASSVYGENGGEQAESKVKPAYDPVELASHLDKFWPGQPPLPPLSVDTYGQQKAVGRDVSPQANTIETPAHAAQSDISGSTNSPMYQALDHELSRLGSSAWKYGRRILDTSSDAMLNSDEVLNLMVNDPLFRKASLTQSDVNADWEVKRSARRGPDGRPVVSERAVRSAILSLWNKRRLGITAPILDGDPSPPTRQN
jgi:hypothetical protein